MKTYFILSILLIISTIAIAQKTTITYRTPGDRVTNYYLTITPVGQPKGLLVLLPGFGGSPESEYAETDLPKEAARRGLLTIIATLQQGLQSFCVDDKSQQTLHNLIQEVQVKYRLTDQKLYVGGFSLGGSGAVLYAERAIASGASIPNAIFAIDPPLDFVRLYESMQKTKRQSKAEVAVNEAAFLTERMRQEFGGEPARYPKRYSMLSPYCHSDTNRINAAWLKKMPIRLITEPDIAWQMQDRNRDLYDLNTIDCVALINYLRLVGNTNAVFVQTTGKGYRRQPRRRNPHSWSIADPKMTIDWLLKF